MDVVDALRASGIEVRALDPPAGLDPPADGKRPDTLLDVHAGDAGARFAVEEKARAPYPNELHRLAAVRDAIAASGEPLLVVPFVSEALAEALTAAGWSWADAHGNYGLRASGLVLRQRRTRTRPKPKRTRLPQGSGSLAIIRALISFGGQESEEASATALAAQAKVSQPRASQVLHQLQDLGLVQRTAEGRWTPRRDDLLDRFLAEYRGPGGSERYLYSLEPPSDVAARAASSASTRRLIAVSADVGPDLLLAWRRPTMLILYTHAEIEPSHLELVEARGRHDANVIMRHPRDTSVFPVPELVAELRGVEIPLADPAQLIWDLQDLGGTDRLEAGGMLREWLLKLP
jgi:DNA-binding transcriptional ArsR family regulator